VYTFLYFFVAETRSSVMLSVFCCESSSKIMKKVDRDANGGWGAIWSEWFAYWNVFLCFAGAYLPDW